MFRTIASFTIAVLLAAALAGCGGSNGNAADNSAANNVAAENSPVPSNTTMPNCGAVKPVWVNTKTKVYHEPNDRFYGKTKHGEYLCPSQAKAQGFHPVGYHHGAEKSQ